MSLDEDIGPIDTFDDLDAIVIGPIGYFKAKKRMLQMHEAIGIAEAKKIIIDDLVENHAVSKKEAKAVSQGEGVTIAIFDSGFDKNHPHFKQYKKKNMQGKIEGKSFVKKSGAVYVYKSDDDFSPSSDHGLMVASVISAKKYGILPRVGLYNLKIFHDEGHPLYRPVIDGLEYILKNEIPVDLVNMSFRLYCKSKVHQDRAVHLMKLCSEFRENGIALVASIGNNNTKTKYLSPITGIPAVFEDVFGVGATCSTKDDQEYHTPCDFNPEVPFAEGCAPGKSILVATMNDNTGRYGQGIASGTSFAAAIVTSVLGMAIAYIKKMNELYYEENPNKRYNVQEKERFDLIRLLKETACGGGGDEEKPYDYAFSTESRRELGDFIFNAREEFIIQKVKERYGEDTTITKDIIARYIDSVKNSRYERHFFGNGRIDAAKFMERVIAEYDPVIHHL